MVWNLATLNGVGDAILASYKFSVKPAAKYPNAGICAREEVMRVGMRRACCLLYS